jgi:hypothetical protein
MSAALLEGRKGLVADGVPVTETGKSSVSVGREDGRGK